VKTTLSSYLTIFLSISFSGCLAFGVPYTNDPNKKLLYAQTLFITQGRPLPAERLINEVIETCLKANNTECLAEAYSTYGLFFDSNAVKRFEAHYRKSGFWDETANYEKRFSKSIEYLTKAISLKAKNVKYYVIRGGVYEENGQNDLALADFEKAIAINPNFAPPYYGRGIVFKKLKKYDLAQIEFEKAISLNPDDFRFYISRIQIYNEKGQYQKTIQDYNQIIDLRPKSVWAYKGRANAYDVMGQYHQAAYDYSKAISLGSNEDLTYFKRGKVLFCSGNFENAEKDFKRDDKFFPHLPNPYISLWVFLATEHQGKSGQEKLATSSKKINLTVWPGPLVSLYLKNITPEETMRKATDPYKQMEIQKQLEAKFFIGQYYLLQKEKAKQENLIHNSSLGKIDLTELGAPIWALRRGCQVTQLKFSSN
jgi:tetratricopeptide (TPR) repeat protein